MVAIVSRAVILCMKLLKDFAYIFVQIFVSEQWRLWQQMQHPRTTHAPAQQQAITSFQSS
jgi:hypothetical protein